MIMLWQTTIVACASRVLYVTFGVIELFCATSFHNKVHEREIRIVAEIINKWMVIIVCHFDAADTESLFLFAQFTGLMETPIHC